MVIALWSAGLSVACAADAFFTPDGKTVTLTTFPRGLGTVDVETGAFTPIALPKALQDGAITSIARGADGEILFLAKDAVWVLKGQEPVRQVCKTSPLLQATDLVVVTHNNPALKDWIMISAMEKPSDPGGQELGLRLYVRKPGDEDFLHRIICRRTPNVTSGTFTPDGRFFFVCEGDVWEGGVSHGVLTAARVASLATFSTDVSNAGAMWVRQVAVAGKWIYAVLRGHHMGAIVRTPMPAHPLSEEPSVTKKYHVMAEALAKAEEIDVGGEYIDNFCVCEVKGRTRLFLTERGKLTLWEDKGGSIVIGHLPEP